MNTSVKKFLEFNGKDILFLSIDGQYWVALKPICDALGVNWNRQFQNLKIDPIFGPEFAKQQMQIPGDQLRNMISLPERWVYGWLTSIRSESKDLIRYKRECYDVLFNYFHGTIGKRHNALLKKAQDELELQQLETELNSDQRFQRYQKLKGSIARSGKELKKLDTELMDSQLKIFSNDNI